MGTYASWNTTSRYAIAIIALSDEARGAVLDEKREVTGRVVVGSIFAHLLLTRPPGALH
jgi:hypothetical protein